MNCSEIVKYFVILLVLCIGQTASYASNRLNDPASLLSDEIMEERIASITDLVEGKYTPVVKTYLKNHITRYPQATEKLLGRKTLYFPIFEEELQKNGLPDDLKYLPIIESGLNPRARSQVGATGLWQFMPGTAKMTGLKINQYVDERKNPIRSTQAAISHLKKLYAIYNDWALVLAAYNSGPGNVNKAIRKANSRDFWEIRPYLPRETREYVSVYVAVNYLFKNYLLHDLSPLLPELDLQITGKISVFDHLSFKDLATWTEIPIDLIKKLNPGFKQNYVPASFAGYTLVLPKRTIAIVESRLSNLEENTGKTPLKIQAGSYQKIMFEAVKGDKISDIAAHFNVNPFNIFDWNGTHIGDVFTHDMTIVLNVYALPNEGIDKPSFRAQSLLPVASLIPAIIFADPIESTQSSTILCTLIKIRSAQERISPYILSSRKKIKLYKGQSIRQYIRSLPDMTLEKLLTLNDLASEKELKIGKHYFIE